jgi:hypothetical protein
MAGVDLAGLETVDWASTKHASGPATDVPNLIRALASPEEDIRRGAWTALYANLYQQGVVYPATAAAAPFFVRLVEGDDVQGKAEILRYLAVIGEDADVAKALIPQVPLLESIAASSEPSETKDAACLALATLEKQDKNLSMTVERLYDAQEDPTIRAHMLWALGSSLDLSDAQVERLLEGLDDPSPAVRFAAAVGACRRNAASEECEKILVEAVLEPQGIDAWLETSPWETAHALDLALGLLATLPKERIAQHYGKLVEALERHRADAWIARAILFFLLEKVFPEKVPDSAADLGTLEVRVLEVMLSDSGEWSTNVLKQTSEHLAAHGLPATQSELDAWLKAR